LNEQLQNAVKAIAWMEASLHFGLNLKRNKIFYMENYKASLEWKQFISLD
jgi:hypothetical protein